jgi:RHS repeat-associated protein
VRVLGYGATSNRIENVTIGAARAPIVRAPSRGRESAAPRKARPDWSAFFCRTDSRRARRSATIGAVRAFVHDAGGNITSDTRSGLANAYTYNIRNRMNTATVGGVLKGTYTYNGLEQLAIRVTSNMTPSGTTHFIHDLMGNVIAETAGGGATGATGTVREYIWLPEGEITPTFRARAQVDRPLAVVNAVNTTPATWYVHVDHLARPIRMTSSTKVNVWDAIWQPWGGQHAITGTAVLDARFPGQWFQLETGLHYNWNRSYDPTIGRYTQPDPLGFVDGPSVYAYAANSPQVLFDFEGAQTRRGGGGRNLTPGGRDMSPPMIFPRGGSGPVRQGQAGEQQVRNQCDIGNPQGMNVNVRNRRPDGVNDSAISEVKSGQYVPLSEQLRDYVQRAGETGRTMDLYTTNPGAQLSAPLQSLIESSGGQIRHNPNFTPK